MTTMDAATYKAALDASIHVLSQLGAGFAPRAEDTPSMKIVVDPGALFSDYYGGFYAKEAQTSTIITAPGSNSKIVRAYLDNVGDLKLIEGSSAPSPVAPSYPINSFPIAKVQIYSTTTSITNLMIEDERAFGSLVDKSKNSFLFTSSSTFIPAMTAAFLKITACGGGGGGGGGSSTAADATKYGGGGGGGGASVLSRLFYPESLTITIGTGGTGGNSATTTAAAATAGASATATTITGQLSGSSITCNGGAGGAAATATANGAGGAGGTSGTGVAGTAGSAGVTNTNGGNGGGTGIGGTMSLRGEGAILASARIGSAGIRGSGGGGGCGYTADGSGKGGNGGNGFVLIEVF